MIAHVGSPAVDVVVQVRSDRHSSLRIGVALTSMWPWDHLAAGYIVYSLLKRLTGRHPPSALAVGFVLIGTQLPDLIDKPLGWYFHILPSGASLAHSLLFAVPLCLVVLAWRAWRGAVTEGIAFSVGYLLHLPADVFYPVLVGAGAKPYILFWPLVDGPHSNPADVTDYLAVLIDSFLTELASPNGLWLVAIEVGFVGSAAVLWYLDGLPGLPVGSSSVVVRQPERDR